MKRLIYLFMFVLLVSLVSAQNVTVKGIVVDSLDNLVGYADIKLDCLESQLFKTDKFGTFSITNVPSGMCRIYATYKDGIGFEDLTIVNKSLYVEVMLDKTIITLPEKKNYWPATLLIALILFIVWYFYSKKPSKKPETVQEAEKPEVKTRAEDILKILSAKEQKIVKLLMGNKDTMLQANIRHELGLPRTSLTRLLQGLKGKNIVETKKMGKTVKVSLTGWYLGKNQ